MIPLVTSDINFFSALHSYQYTSDYIYDIVMIGELNQRLTYIAINRTTSDIIAQFAIPYKSATTRLFNAYFPKLYQTDLSLISTFGFYRMDNSTSPETVRITIFILQQHNALKTYFLAQCDIINHDITTMQLLAIEKYINVSTPEFIDVMIRSAVIYTDTKSISNYQTFIITKGVNGGGTPSIIGIQVFVTTAEKLEFQTAYNLSLIATPNPIVDQWSGTTFPFLSLPPGTIKHAFNFSTGVGYLTFSD